MEANNNIVYVTKDWACVVEYIYCTMHDTIHQTPSYLHTSAHPLSVFCEDSNINNRPNTNTPSSTDFLYTTCTTYLPHFNISLPITDGVLSRQQDNIRDVSNIDLFMAR